MEQNSALMRGVAMAMHHNADLRQAFREQLIEPEMASSSVCCSAPSSGARSVRTARHWNSWCTC